MSILDLNTGIRVPFSFKDWLPIVISATSLVLSVVLFIQKYMSDKNVKRNCVLKLKEIRQFYYVLIESLNRDNEKIRESATLDDTAYHILDIEDANQILRMLEDFKGLPIPLDVFIISQIGTVNKLIKYEKNMDSLITKHSIPNGLTHKENLRTPEFLKILNMAKKQLVKINEYILKIDGEIETLGE